MGRARHHHVRRAAHDMGGIDRGYSPVRGAELARAGRPAVRERLSMMPDRRGLSWWQKIRRAATGLRMGLAAPGNTVATPDSGEAAALSWVEPGALAERLESG